MTQAERPKPGLRRRDWFLLPAVSLLTICVLAASTELVSRWLYPENRIGFQNCFATNDPSGSAAVKPGGVCWEQTPESPATIEYRFNRNGHRAGVEMTPKQPGTLRIVLIGSSLTQGLYVAREQSFAALLPAELSLDTGRRVEVYNEATGGKFRGGPYPAQNSVQHFGEILAAQPDLILWVITPTDVLNFGSMENSANSMAFASAVSRQDGLLAEAGPKMPLTSWQRIVAVATGGHLVERLKAHWEASRTSIALRHFLIASKSQDEYIKSYLQDTSNASFLMTKPDTKWQAQLQSFNAELAEIVGLARKAGIPIVAVLVPNRAQAAMISNGAWPNGFDPFKLNNEVRNNITSHGGQFIDILPDFRSISHPERDYFPVDGHPDAGGQAIIAKFLAKELTKGAVPDLRSPNQREIAMQPVK